MMAGRPREVTCVLRVARSYNGLDSAGIFGAIGPEVIRGVDYCVEMLLGGIQG